MPVYCELCYLHPVCPGEGPFNDCLILEKAANEAENIRQGQIVDDDQGSSATVREIEDQAMADLMLLNGVKANTIRGLWFLNQATLGLLAEGGYWDD